MKILLSWLQEYIKEKLPKPEKLAEILTMHSFETNVIDKDILEADVLPNRAHDCLSYIGIARECAALLNSKLKAQNSKQQFKTKNLKTKKFLEVKVENTELCPRYCAMVILDVKIGPSPKWMQERLLASGMRPINNVVDATNYVMLEYGQPIHAFDFDKIKGVKIPNSKNIIIRKAKQGELIVTLDGQKRELDDDILVIADSERPIAIAGIMGGANTETGNQTKNIILESANFESSNILKSSKKLKLKSEASIRFEKGIDPNLADIAMNRAASLIQQIGDGEVCFGIIDIYSKKIAAQKIILDLDYLNSFLGIKMPLDKIIKILKFLEFGVKKSGNKKLLVTVPTFRLDITIPQDLTEEIGRIYGYEKFPAAMPVSVLAPSQRNDELFYENQVRQILAGAGLSEVYNYSFVGDEEVLHFGFESRHLVEVQNPTSIAYKYLRPCLAINLLKNIKDNLRFFNEVGIFEIGKVFNPREKKALAGALTGAFYELKGVLDLMFNKMGISDIWYDDSIPEADETKIIEKIFHPDRKAQIKIGGELIGWLGEINSEIIDFYGIKNRVAVFGINFEKLVNLATEERIYTAPSKYPAIVRDLSVLVEPEIKIERVLNILETAGGELLRDVDLFDWYEGEEVGDKKGLAFHLIFQSDEKTLSDSEINKLQEKIIKAVEDEGWEVRR